VGDHDGARRVDVVGDEELPHVRFALHWFRRMTGCDDFETWSAHLPPPLSPVLMKAPSLDRSARVRAGFGTHFLDALEATTLCTRDASGS
jgi:uncharacterized ferritin-like protein (DUF455 family)